MASEDIILRIKTMMDTGDVSGAVKELQSSFGKLKLAGGVKGDFDKIFSDLIKSAKQFEGKAKGSFEKAADVSALKKSRKEFDAMLSGMLKSLQKLSGREAEEVFEFDLTGIKRANQQIEELQQKAKNAVSSATDMQKIKTALESMGKITTKNISFDIIKDLKAGNVEGAISKFKELQAILKNFSNGSDLAKTEIQNFLNALNSGDITKIETSLQSLLQNIDKIGKGKTGNLGNFATGLRDIGIEITNAKNSTKDLDNQIEQLRNTSLGDLADQAKQGAIGLEEIEKILKALGVEFDKVGDKAQGTADDMFSLNKQVEGLRSRAAYFFGIENAVQLLKRGLRSTIETVKELDKAMTETAVVTDFSVGDMWDKLPQYTKMANELGVATKGVYEASTLYYQQGLETEQVMALTNETLKMARIAGLECAEATDLMTAALRGFNMEVNEANAQRVNDVYSELAAITAADTQEIATAMTKTASIAQSANMELETTAALLAQIIETTREPAETAGTAMKTIIARFSEMKKSTSDLVEVDGEQVSVNKVEDALKSAGVALRDVNGEFRNLDDVFLELSSKWNSLDVMTQRYIATTAAGSRQQSRFIAMMSNYDRTMQLVNSAYSSSGASAKQFEKTQESLETKLNKLTNAWNEFLMGISNSTVIKGAVDLLTGILNVVNKVTGAFGEGIGGILKFGVALGTLKIGKDFAIKALGEAALYSEDLKKGGYELASSESKKRLTKKFTQFSEKIEGRDDVKSYRAGKTESVSDELKGTRVEAAKTEEALADIGDGATRGSQKAKAPLEMTEKEIEDIKRKAREARLELARMDPDADVDDFIDSFGTNPSGNKINEAFKGDKAHLIASDKARVRGLLGDVEAGKELDKGLETGEIVVKSTGSGGNVVEGVGDIVEGTGDIVKGAEGAGDAAEGVGDIVEGMGDAAKVADDAGDAVEEFGDAVKKTGKEAAGKGAKGVGSLGKAFGGAVKSAWAFLAANPAIIAGVVGIAAIAGAAYAAWYFSAEQSAKRVAEAHKAQLDETKSNIEATRQSILELEAAWNSFDANESALESMIQGTQAWKDKLNEANNEVRELLKTYPELIKYLEVDEKTGQLKIRKEGQQKILEDKKQQQENLGLQETIQSILLEYSERVVDLREKYNTGISENEMKKNLLIALQYDFEEAKNLLGTDLDTPSAKAAFEKLMQDFSVEEYIKENYGEASQYIKNIWYFRDKSKLDQEIISRVNKETQSHLISQGYDAVVAEAASEAYTSGENFFEEYIASSSFNKTGDTLVAEGINAGQGVEGTWAERVQKVMVAQGYELIDSTTNKYRHKDTGKEVNVNRVGGGMPGEEVKDEVETWSDEYIRELEIQMQLAEKFKTKSEEYAKFFQENKDLAKAYVGDLTADLSKYSFNDQGQLTYDGQIVNDNIDQDGNAIVTQEKFDEIQKGIRERLDKLSLKYFGGSKGAGEEYTAEEKQLLQGLNEIEEATKDFSKTAQANLVRTYFAFTVFEDKGVEALEGSAEAFKELKDQIDETGATAEGFSSFIKGLSSSAIAGAKQLKKFRSQGGANAVYSKLVEQQAKDQYGAGAQIKEMLSDEGWQEAENKLGGIFSTYGKITSDDVRELSGDFKALNDVLDIGTVKASALAKMFEQVAQGELSLTDITQDLADMYNMLYYSADLAGDAIAKLKEAKIRSTRRELGDIYTDAWKSVKETINSGAEGDIIIDDYMSQMVGQETWQQALDTKGSKAEAVDYIDSIYHLSANNGNMAGSWQGILADNPNNGMFSMANGQISWDLTGIENTADLIAKMAESFGITEEYASALVGDLTTYSDEFGRLLRKMDKIAAVDEYINSSFREVGGQYYTSLTKEQLANYSKAMGQEEDYLEKEIEKRAGNKPISYGYKTSEHGYFHVKDNGEINFAKGVNADGENTYQAAAREMRKAFDVEEGKPIEIPVIVDEGNLSDQMKTFLSTGFGQDLWNQILNFEGNEEEFKKSPLFTQIKSALETAGFAGAEALAAGLFTNKDIIEDYMDNLDMVAQNEVGKTMKAIANVLSTYKFSIPISLDLGGSTFGRLLAQFFPWILQGTKTATITIGGEGTSFANDAEEEFTPTEVDFGSFEPGGDLDPEGIDPYTDDPKDSGGGSSDKEKTDPAEANADRELEALDRIQKTLEREASLISKLPEELAAPLKLINMGENLAVEIRRDEIERNKLGALEGQKTALESEADYLGEYYYYDKALEAYIYNVDKINSLDNDTRSKVEEEKAKLDEISGKINETRDAVSGGKIQKVFYGLEKQTKNLSKVFEKNAESGRSMAQAMLEIFEDTPLDKFKYLASGIGQTIDNTNLLNKSYKGLINNTDKVAEIMSNLEETPLGQKLGESTKDLIGHILGGGTGNEFAGAATGALSEMFGGIGDFLTFDVMEQGLDMFNQMKGMAEKAVQTIVQYVQTIANWWTNREDWLYNLLTSIEKEVQNFNRQENVEDRFRAYSTEGYDELMEAYQAMQASLDEQYRLNKQLIASRQSEMMFVNLSNLPFYPAFHYDRKKEKMVENPWVYNIYTLLLDLGATLPMIGEFFPIIKSLMEDNKKRMEEMDDEISDARDRLEELEKEQLELNTQYMEDQIELEKLVMDSIIEKQQEEIDKLSLLNDAITDANAKLIETLNSNLEKIRQQRENEKKEEELGEKERRLAYLRQDTSGANRQEIKKLEEELENERRDYTDTLIDQRISDLEEQNDKAAEQRQKQIDLLQSQLDYTQRYGLQWEEAQELIKNGFDSEGRLKVGTDLYNMLMAKEEITSLGMGSASEWQALKDWEITGVAAKVYQDINKVWERLIFGPLKTSGHDEDAQQKYDGDSFLKDIFDSLWNFIKTGFFSGDESTSIWGKTLIPLFQELFNKNKNNHTPTQAEGAGHIEETATQTGENLGSSFIAKIGNAFSDIGNSITEGFKNLIEDKNANTQTSTQTVGDINMEFHINSEDGESGMDIAESIVSAFKQGISNLSIFK